MKKIIPTEAWKSMELLLENQAEKEAEKAAFMAEFETAWDNTFGKIDGLCLYFTSVNRTVPDEEYHHKPLSEIKSLFLKELSEVYDKAPFFRAEIERIDNSSKDDLTVTLWVRTTECSQNGNSVYVRFCTKEKYQNTENEIKAADMPEKIKAYCLQKLENTAFEPDTKKLKKRVLEEIKDLLADAISELQDGWNEYMSLKANDIIPEICEFLEDCELYRELKDEIIIDYEDDDTLLFKFKNDEELLRLRRRTVVTHEYDY